jgi:uncharacterized protein YeeX (DUF496 family)
MEKREKDKENKMDVEGDATAEAKQILEGIIAESLVYIETVPNLIDFAKHFESKLEYSEVIKVGYHCERVIENLYKKIEEKELYTQRLNAIQIYISTNPALREEHDLITKLLEKDYKDLSSDKLKDWTISITKIMMDAANIENDFNTLKEQAILAFKVDTTEERWNQVRNVTPENEWLEVKQNLVGYMLNNIGNINDKIDLLLKDGLYKQCAEIFPAPSSFFNIFLFLIYYFIFSLLTPKCKKL